MAGDLDSKLCNSMDYPYQIRKVGNSAYNTDLTERWRAVWLRLSGKPCLLRIPVALDGNNYSISPNFYLH